MALQPTSAQQKIYDFIEHGQGNGIIDAVAGAGKTTTLMACIMHTPNIYDVLFCAFNRCIRDEIHKKFRKNKKNVRVNTIHSLGFRMLRAISKYNLDDHKYEKIIKDPDFFTFIEPKLNKILYFHNYPTVEEVRQYSPDASNPSKELEEAKRFLPIIVSRLLDINQKYRCTLSGNSFEQYDELVKHFEIFAPHSKELAAQLPQHIWQYTPEELNIYIDIHQSLLEKGNKIALSEGTIDYTDQLYLPYLKQLTAKDKYGFVFVDECQDLSPAQLYVVKQYLRSDGRLLAVGDPFQAIYGFAGADCESFNRIKNTFNCKPLGLTDCFRCPQNVIQLAQTIRTDIKGFKTEAGVVRRIRDNEIEDLIEKGDLVICRARDPLRRLAMELINRDLMVKIHPDELEAFIGDYNRNFTTQELREVLTDDTVNAFFKRVIQRNEKRIRRENHNTDQAIKEQVVEDEMKIIKETMHFLENKFFDWQLNTVESLLKRLKMMLSNPNEDAIKLSTIHRAKGLENRRVFILNYDSLPLSGNLEWVRIQERNLHYVAVTRAKETLFLCVDSNQQRNATSAVHDSSVTSPSAPSVLNPQVAIKEEAEPEDDFLRQLSNTKQTQPAETASVVLPPVISSIGRPIDFRPVQKLSKISNKFYAFDNYEDTPYSALNRTTFQKAKYWSINDHLQDTEFSISNVISLPYRDDYYVSTPNGIEIYIGYYKQTGQYNFVPQGNCINADQLMCCLTDESNYKIKFDYQPQNQGFDAVHGIITAACNDLGVCITNIYNESYALVYCLKTPCSYGYIKLAYNARHIITTAQPFSTLEAEDEKLNAILESLKHLWQR